jgi:hypothetical protein
MHQKDTALQLERKRSPVGPHAPFQQQKSVLRMPGSEAALASLCPPKRACPAAAGVWQCTGFLSGSHSVLSAALVLRVGCSPNCRPVGRCQVCVFSVPSCVPWQDAEQDPVSRQGGANTLLSSPSLPRPQFLKVKKPIPEC